MTTNTRTQFGRAFRVNAHTDVWSLRRKRRRRRFNVGRELLFNDTPSDQLRGRRVIEKKHSNPDRMSAQDLASG